MKTLLIGEIHPEAHELLKSKTDLQQINNEHFCSAFPTEQFKEVEALILRTFTPCRKHELNYMPNLKYIVSCSVGTNNLDLEEMKQKNIELIHVPGTNANSVAEHTLYLIMSVLREDAKKPVAELKNKTVGIIGFGAIGKIVAKKLAGTECKIIAFDVIEQKPEVLAELKTTIKTFDEVVSEADVLTIHVPLNKHTEGLINLETFSKMKQNSFFINTSREEVIDEQALLQQQDKFRGIGLDVYSDKLKKSLQGNIVLTDHIAAQGEESFRQQCLQPVEKFLEK